MQEMDSRTSPELVQGETDSETREPFIEPKLTWVEPELVSRGVIEAEAAFFGTFSP